MNTTCNNCGTFCTFSVIYNDDRIIRCSECNGYQWMGTVSSLEGLYTRDYFNGDEYVAYDKSAEIYRLNLARKLQALLRAPFFSNKSKTDYLKERVFEVGSATGEFLKILREQKFNEILGSDISAFCREVAAEEGFALLNPLAVDCMDSIQKFNPTILCAWDVWEHLDNPCSYFSDLINSNSDMSVVALTTVDSGALVPRINGKRWRQFHPPTHLNYPTTKSFELFFKSVGFRITAAKSFGYYRPLADYLSVFAGRKRIANLKVLFKIPLYLNLFDIQLVVAERVH